MRPPESATVCGWPWEVTLCMRVSQASAAAWAKANGLSKRRSSKLSIIQNSGHWLWIAPGMAARFEQFVGGLRAPRAGGIKLPLAQRPVVPSLANGIDNAPGGFNFIAPNK